jgi:uncharacterized protein YecT (DUF1311 family)
VFRKIPAVAILLILSFIGMSSAGAEAPDPQPKHPIDQREADCIDGSDGGDFAMKECTYRAFDEWDAALNKVYRQLIGMLPPADAESLRRSQRRWIAFRDAEFEVIDAAYRDQQGTIAGLMRASERTGFVRERVLQLESHRDLFTGCAFDHTLCGDAHGPASEESTRQRP